MKPTIILQYGFKNLLVTACLYRKIKGQMQLLKIWYHNPGQNVATLEVMKKEVPAINIRSNYFNKRLIPLGE